MSFFEVSKFESRWRFIANYKDESGKVVSMFSDFGTYQEIDEKRNMFIKNINQVGELLFTKIVAEAI